MMIITFIEKGNPSSREYIVHLDDGQTFSVHEDTMIRHRLLKGTRLTEEQIARILRDHRWQGAYEAAVRFITRKPRSKKEVQDQLRQQGYEADLVQSVSNALEERGYIDDRQLARILVEQRILSQKKGRKLVLYELQQKGFSPEHIRFAFSLLEDGAEEENAYHLLSKKIPFLSGNRLMMKRKLIHYLLRRGYSQPVVRQAILRWNEEHPDQRL